MKTMDGKVITDNMVIYKRTMDGSIKGTISLPSTELMSSVVPVTYEILNVNTGKIERIDGIWRLDEVWTQP